MAMEKKNLAAGIREMRSVAKRLMAWADDLEKNSGVADPDAGAASAGDSASAPAGVAVADSGSAVGSAAPAVPTRAEVKGFLAKLCASGYSAQVKALIASYGATSLSGVSEEALGDLWNAALLIGQEDGHAG